MSSFSLFSDFVDSEAFSPNVKSDDASRVFRAVEGTWFLRLGLGLQLPSLASFLAMRLMGESISWTVVLDCVMLMLEVLLDDWCWSVVVRSYWSDYIPQPTHAVVCQGYWSDSKSDSLVFMCLFWLKLVVCYYFIHQPTRVAADQRYYFDFFCNYFYFFYFFFMCFFWSVF